MSEQTGKVNILCRLTPSELLTAVYSSRVTVVGILSRLGEIQFMFKGFFDIM